MSEFIEYCLINDHDFNLFKDKPGALLSFAVMNSIDSMFALFTQINNAKCNFSDYKISIDYSKYEFGLVMEITAEKIEVLTAEK